VKTTDICYEPVVMNRAVHCLLQTATLRMITRTDERIVLYRFFRVQMA